MRSTIALLALLATTACATQRIRPSGAMEVAPALSVETFLQAANRSDFETMAQIFGTADGPIGDTGSTLGCGFKRVGSWIGLGDRCISWLEVELRMSMIADVLKNEDYRLLSDERVPGRNHPTTRVAVTLQKNGSSLAGIPFVVVQGKDGAWFVEEIGLDVVTAARR